MTFDELREHSAKLLIEHLHVLGYSGAEAEALWKGEATVLVLDSFKPLEVDLPDRVVDQLAQAVGYRFEPSQEFYDFAQNVKIEVLARL